MALTDWEEILLIGHVMTNRQKYIGEKVLFTKDFYDDPENRFPSFTVRAFHKEYNEFFGNIILIEFDEIEGLFWMDSHFFARDEEESALLKFEREEEILKELQELNNAIVG